MLKPMGVMSSGPVPVVYSIPPAACPERSAPLRDASGPTELPQGAIYGVFPTTDGHIAVVGVAFDVRPAFYQAIGLPELTGDPRFALPMLTPENRKILYDLLLETFRKKPTAEWERILKAAGQRYSPVRTYAEVARDKGTFLNGYLQRIDHSEWGETIMIGCPIRLSETPASPGRFAPELGQHTEEILLELGYGWEDITAFRDSNTISKHAVEGSHQRRLQR